MLRLRRSLVKRRTGIGLRGPPCSGQKQKKKNLGSRPRLGVPLCSVIVALEEHKLEMAIASFYSIFCRRVLADTYEKQISLEVYIERSCRNEPANLLLGPVRIDNRFCLL